MPNDVISIVRFPITPDTNLSRHGKHNGLRFKISNHGRHKQEGAFYECGRENGTWCYYVYIPEYMLPAEQFEKFWLPVARNLDRSSGIIHPCYDHYNTDWSDCDWHGGVTWYAKLGGHDGAPRVAEIGCDYVHLFDAEREYYYSYAEVEHDAKHTIDLLCKLYQFYQECSYTGKCLPRNEMVEHEGRFYAKEGFEEWLKWQNEKTA